MSKKVLDSSAVLAVIFQEKGAEIVEPQINKAQISSVSVAEVFSKLAEKGALTRQTIEDFQQLGIEIVNLDCEQAAKAAELRPLTKHLGLSLGDRCCLALTILRNSTAVTADKNWQTLDLCPVEVIR